MNVSENYLRLKKQVFELASGAVPEIVPVSKGYSWEHVEPVYQLGVRDFAENRLQEAFQKMEKAPPDVRWHLIGTLQKNKVRKAVGSFVLIHSVNSLELLEKISECSQEKNCITALLLQVNTSGEETKHGMTPAEWEGCIERIAQLPGIRVEGLMTMAPLTEDREKIRHCFATLRYLRDQLSPHFPSYFRHLSMGMSHDYPIAIAEGATLLRIGSAIFLPKMG